MLIRWHELDTHLTAGWAADIRYHTLLIRDALLNRYTLLIDCRVLPCLYCSRLRCWFDMMQVNGRIEVDVGDAAGQ